MSLYQELKKLLSSQKKGSISSALFPLRELIHAHENILLEPSDKFFKGVHTARNKFLSATHDDLDKKLLGLKISNLLITKHEYLRGSVVKIARPISFMLDTANQCQLGCPSCTNSINRLWAETTFNPWPRGVMKEDQFKKFINNVGLSAFAGHFYNNHEPFLNKNTASYLRTASDMHIETFVSSNLSFPRLDYNAIVNSGLKELMVAADGITQETYERYRKGGRLDWVFENVAAIADAKKRLGATTPYLRWQYLTFAHNIHEVPRAIKFAKEIGFDSFNLATPNRVDADDPTIESIHYNGPEEHLAVVFNQRAIGNFSSDLEPYRAMIDRELSENLIDRWYDAGGSILKQPVDSGDRCDWLHMAVISDAMGRIVPCCIGDYKGVGEFVFANIDEHHHNLLNTKLYQESRILLADPTMHRQLTEGRDQSTQTRCLKCPVRPPPQIGLGAVHSWFVWSAASGLKELTSEEILELHNWSRHQIVRSSLENIEAKYIGRVESNYLNDLPMPDDAELGPVIIKNHIAGPDLKIDLFIHVSLGEHARTSMNLYCQGLDKTIAIDGIGSGWLHFQLTGMTSPGIFCPIFEATVDEEIVATIEGSKIKILPGGVVSFES